MTQGKLCIPSKYTVVRLLILFHFFTLLLFSLPAQAEKKEAQRLFKRGTELFQQEKFAEAAEAFRAANAELPNWKIYYNIAQSEMGAKRYGRAMEAFETYLAEGGDDLTFDRIKEVEAEMDRLERLVGFVTIAGTEGDIVVIDNVKRGVLPLPGPLMVTAGVIHELRISSGNTLVVERNLKVIGGQTIHLSSGQSDSDTDFEPQSETTVSDSSRSNEDVEANPSMVVQSTAPGTTASPPLPVSRKRKLIPAGIAIAAAGGATLIAGAITGSKALSLSKSLENDCLNNNCTSAYHNDNSQMQVLANLTDVLIPVGGALVVVGVTMILVGRKPRESDTVSIIPYGGFASCGLHIEGEF